MAKFLMNDVEVVFNDNDEIVEKLNADDEFTLLYIQTEIDKGFLEQFGIYTNDINTLSITRVNTDEDDEDEDIENSENLTDEAIWKSKGKPRAKDIEATEFFLQLRRSDKYNKMLKDKKTVKYHVWEKVANEMNDRGYFVGEGKQGGKRCLQKFNNLSKSYVNFIKHVNKTGEAKKPPEFFELLHDILGSQHKINPTYISESLEITQTEPTNGPNTVLTEKQSMKQIDNDIESASSSSSAKDSAVINGTSTETPKSRYKAIKTSVKPPKNEVIQVLQEINHNNMTILQEQFGKLEKQIERQNDMLLVQNEQRNSLINILENLISKKHKRRYSSSDDD